MSLTTAGGISGAGLNFDPKAGIVGAVATVCGVRVERVGGGAPDGSLGGGRRRHWPAVWRLSLESLLAVLSGPGGGVALTQSPVTTPEIISQQSITYGSFWLKLIINPRNFYADLEQDIMI
jgi:hypothetical protein